MIPHFHLDIETLGRTPGSVILSIGVVQVDFVSGTLTKSLHVNIDQDDCEFYGLTTEPETVKWWEKQSDAAKASTFDKTTAVSLPDALRALSTFMGEGDKEVSCCGTDFDIPILVHAYKVTGLPVPWQFNKVQDYRTLRQWFRQVAKPADNGAAHDALADATWQATHMLRIWRYVNSISGDIGRNVVVNAQADMRAFLDARGFADESRVRAILSEYEKMKAERALTLAPAVEEEL